MGGNDFPVVVAHDRYFLWYFPTELTEGVKNPPCNVIGPAQHPVDARIAREKGANRATTPLFAPGAKEGFTTREPQ